MKALIYIKIEKTPSPSNPHLNLNTEMHKIDKTIYFMGIPVFKKSLYLTKQSK